MSVNRWGMSSDNARRYCHPKLRDLFDQALRTHDLKWLSGFRSKANQDRAYNAGNSKLRWPDSKHNQLVTVSGVPLDVEPMYIDHNYVPEEGYYVLAADVVPWVDGRGVPWNDQRLFDMIAGMVLHQARIMKIQVRWGGDWDQDMDVHDQTFNDLGHWELIL